MLKSSVLGSRGFIWKRAMRVKMRTLMTFLALIVGVFMIGDLFLFSNVGNNARLPRSETHESPYHIGDGEKYIKRQIKSGREFLTGGIRSFADKLYETPDDVIGRDHEKYGGVRDSVLGAMDIPGMRQKVLPVEVDARDSEVFGGEFGKVRDLERSLMDGTLREDEVEDSSHEEVVVDEMGFEDFDGDGQGDAEDESDDQEETFNWGDLFGFGNKETENELPLGNPKIGDAAIEMGAINVPGMDDRILSKIKLQSDSNEELFQKKVAVEEPTEDQLEEQWIEDLKNIKGLADSVPQWPMEEDRRVQEKPAVMELPPEPPTVESAKPTSSAYSFLANLFQPLRFAGSTGDDDVNDGGWASVGDLDSLVNSVQHAIVPGMQQKVLVRESPGAEPKLFSRDDLEKLSLQAGAEPLEILSQVENQDVPAIGSMEAQPVQPGDQLRVPAIPGVSENFYKKITGVAPAETAVQPSERIQVPNIPGLSEEFFGKYGGAKLDTQDDYAPLQAGKVPKEESSMSAEFFNKFIHPVAGSASASMPQVDNMVAESLEEVPGLPEGFFEKYVRDQAAEGRKVDGAGLKEQGFNVPDIPGLSDYLQQYAVEDGQAAIPLNGLKESLMRVQVPGMPDKILLDGDDAIPASPSLASNLDVVPPSDLPELQLPSGKGGASSSQGLFALLLSAFARKPGAANGVDENGDVNGTAVGDSETSDSARTVEAVVHGQDEEGFRVKNTTESDTVDMQEIIKALVPGGNYTMNDTSLLVGPGEALNLLNQLQGVAAAVAAESSASVSAGSHSSPRESVNAAVDLADITALEEGRVVSCNLTKSPLWKVAITDRWHTVKDGLMFVYSSYLDDRIQGHTAIRILGILEGWEIGMHLKPYCQIWFQDRNDPFVIGATYEWLPGQPIAKFKAVLLTCIYQTSHVAGRPLAVSLTTEPCEPPQFLVKIHTRNETVGIKKTDFTICLTGPMKFGYADVGQFIQWMEFNIMMGVERFVLYNHSMDATLRPYLVHYAKLGYVQLFPWIIPDNIPNPLVFLKNLGHLAMINDCLYRNMWTSKHVVFMDIDEMILPRYGHVTFAPMLKNAGCDVKPQAVVRSVFFRREWPNDELYATNQTIINMGLVGLLKTKRDRKIWPPYMRSKYFIKPNEVLITNVHAAHSFLSPLDYQDLSCIFDAKEVILHHYRYWGEITGNYVVDRRLHEYGDELIQRASNIYEAVLGRKVT